MFSLQCLPTKLLCASKTQNYVLSTSNPLHHYPQANVIVLSSFPINVLTNPSNIPHYIIFACLSVSPNLTVSFMPHCNSLSLVPQ